MTILYLLGGFLTAALLGALIIPNILLISYKKRLFDVPDKRKVHSIPVPRLGGLSFFPVILISVGLTVGTYFFLSAPAGGVEGGALCEFLFLTVGAMLLFLVGVADDLVGVGYRYKFAVQVLAAVLMVLPGEWLNSMGGLASCTPRPAATLSPCWPSPRSAWSSPSGSTTSSATRSAATSSSWATPEA